MGVIKRDCQARSYGEAHEQLPPQTHVFAPGFATRRLHKMLRRLIAEPSSVI